MLYAVCLAGIPGEIINRVKDALAIRYPANFVFTGKGVSKSATGLADYDDQTVADVMSMAAKAIFSKSQRPFGFCRKKDSPCALLRTGKNSCGQSPDHTCLLQKPDFFILIYQEGIGHTKLTDQSHYAPVARMIPRAFYNNNRSTINFCVSVIEQAKPALGIIKKNIESSRSPLLLPPLNYRSRDLKKILDKVQRSSVGADVKRFKKENFASQLGAYTGRSDLKFQPAETAVRHGQPNTTDAEATAISGYFRLGCIYPPDFQYDVQPIVGGHIDKSINFSCRQKGRVNTSETHINITVDDIVL